MKGYSFQWRMAGRRKTASLLVVLFTAVAAVFMLTYPQLINSTRARLEKAFDSLEVSGWLLNSADYEDPNISSELWYTLVNSGYFSEHFTYATTDANIVSKASLEAKAGVDADDTACLWALQTLLAAPKSALDSTARIIDTIRAFNKLEACDDLVRIGDGIQWLDEYSADCLEGDERVCLLPESFGYKPGDTVPILVKASDTSESCGIIRLKVVGIYPGSVPEFNCVMPLKTYEQMRHKAEWGFTLNSFIFTLGDNHQLTEVKQFLIENGLDGTSEDGTRAAVDDRIFQGTVAPIESTLALLEGLYLFFFLVLAAIGFFLCFLLARSRKPEYAIMRMLGESTALVTVKALSEQSIQCLFGILLGSTICLAASLGSPDLLICGGIWLCYTLGAAVAVLLTVRVNVMEILRDKE